MTEEIDKQDQDDTGRPQGRAEEGSKPDPEPDEDRQTRSPGALLRDARERERLSIADLSAQTLLSKSVIEKLENNDLESLGQPVFVRGYYRKCGKALGIDEHLLMEAYAAHTGESVDAPRPTPPLSLDVRPMDATPRERGLLLKPLLILAIIAGAAGIWFALDDGVQEQVTETLDDSGYTELELDSIPSATVVQPQSPDQAGAGQDIGIDGVQGDAGDTQAPAAVPGAEGVEPAATGTEPQSGQAEAGDQPDEVGSEPQAAAVPEDALQLTFDGSSWARIFDADGRRLLDGVFGQGEVRTLEGEPPYQVILGNAPVVRVALGGESIDITGYVEENNTARFTVEAEN